MMNIGKRRKKEILNAIRELSDEWLAGQWEYSDLTKKGRGWQVELKVETLYNRWALVRFKVDRKTFTLTSKHLPMSEEVRDYFITTLDGIFT